MGSEPIALDLSMRNPVHRVRDRKVRGQALHLRPGPGLLPRTGGNIHGYTGEK